MEQTSQTSSPKTNESNTQRTYLKHLAELQRLVDMYGVEQGLRFIALYIESKEIAANLAGHTEATNRFISKLYE
jgi:hypothetical protein